MSTVDSLALTSPRARRRTLLRKRFLRRPMAVGGLLVVLAFVVTAVFAPWLAPHPAAETDFNSLLSHPSSKHLLGTDELGRDVLSRLIWGSRASMQAGLSVCLAASVCSTASTCTFLRGGASGSLAGAVPGSQRCSRSSPAWMSPTPARSPSAARPCPLAGLRAVR